MKIKIATIEDIEKILIYDKHINKNELNFLINQEKVLIAIDNKNFCGWLRYNLFWDNIPFMNMLFVLESYRNKGVGKELVFSWENRMKDLNYKMLMTSTLSNEQAQHFYRKLNYIDAGSLLLPNEPLEIFFIKKIT